MKLIFMGTPEFSVPILDALTKNHEVTAVFTKKDEPQGRKKVLTPSPVKTYAISHGIPVYTPGTLRKEKIQSVIRSLEADAILVAAYGLILPKEVLEAKKYGCINVHTSLLPSYRGASPVQAAILNGETKTGVTIMAMDEGVDTGDILLQEKVEIEEEDNAKTLTEKLSVVASSLILKALTEIEKGTVKRIPQPADSPTPYAVMIEKAMGKLDFTKDAKTLQNEIRAFNPWPTSYFSYNGEPLKVWKAGVVSDNRGKQPGEIFDVTKESFRIASSKGALEILEIQAPGKKRMSIDAFLRGYRIEEGRMAE